MRITKYADKHLEALKNLKDLCELILMTVRDSFPSSKINVFRLSLELLDKEINYENYKEFLKFFDSVDLKKIERGLLFFGIIESEKKDIESVLECKILFGYRDYFTIELSAGDVNIIEKVFYKIFEGPLAKCEIYSYNEIEKKREEMERKEEERKKIVENCINILKNLNSYQTRMRKTLKDEDALQEFIFPILKSHFDSLSDEFHLPRFGAIEYKPDFGIPEAALLIECKYLKEKKDLKRIQKEISEDAIGYLNTSSQYKELIIFIYNSLNIPITEKFEKDFEKINGIERVIIVPGVTPNKKNLNENAA